MLSKEGRIGLVVCTISMVLLGLAPTQGKRTPLLGSQYKLVFHACQGLRVGDPVTLGGVDGGRVVDIDFAPEEDWERLNPPGETRPVVLVTVGLYQGYKLSEGTAYKVVSTLRGRHFINILPPPPGEAVASGAILKMELNSSADDQLLATIKHFKTLSESTKQMRSNFADANFRRDMKDLASNMRFYSAEFARVSQGSRAQVTQMAHSLDRQEAALMANVQRMDEMTARAQARMQTVVPVARAQLAMYRSRLDAGQKQMDQAYKLAEGYTKGLLALKARLESSPLATMDPEKLSQQMHDWKNKLEDYANLAGDMHTLSSDPQIKDGFKEPVRKYKALTEKWKEQVHGFEEQVEPYRWLAPREHQ
ncbi:hypothetical protein JST97_30425 [bacterium]|nr:hypothetical protein [bacterium]